MMQSSSENKDWENDSWKTIPRDDKSWHVYRSAMTEYWSDASASPNKNVGKSGRHEEERRNMRNTENEPGSPTKKERKQQQQQQQQQQELESSQKIEYENTRVVMRCSNERNGGGKYSSNEDHGNRGYNRRSEREEERSRRDRREIETEDDEIEVEVDVEEEEDESYNVSMEYRSEKYESKQYYENHNNEDYRRDTGSKYDNDKTSDSSSQSSESDDETIPETGRKVEQIAQKLEQTAQKYAREHSPPKFIERRSMEYNNNSSNRNSLDRSQDEPKSSPASYEKYEREMRNNRNAQRQEANSRERERDRYIDKSLASSRQSTLTYERERSYEKNAEKKRMERATNRGFERPRPPSQEAPERPNEQQLQQREPQRYRERSYSEKEDIYGETTAMRYPNDSYLVDKDRGYESNFETKLERSKVLERHGYTRSSRMTLTPERNDSNNNSLKVDRKPLMPRQATAMGHLIQTGRGFDIDSKSPKLVKRTKSFWRFRRDSEVLEGMALWQHRSLVDIPKMLKKDERQQEHEKSRDESRKSSSEGSPDPSHRSLERKNSGSTITNERINGIDHSSIQDEPKPAERVHLPEKSSSLDYFEEIPTPAERPKTSERNEYRSSSRHQVEEQRSYFVGNVSRKAILENERKRSMEAKRNMIVAELKENNNKTSRNDRRKKGGAYGDDDDGLMIQHFTETEASDEESTYSCIIVKDQVVADKRETLLPRTKLRRDSERGDRAVEKKTCGPWYDLWAADQSVTKKKKKKTQQQQQQQQQ